MEVKLVVSRPGWDSRLVVGEGGRRKQGHRGVEGEEMRKNKGLSKRDRVGCLLVNGKQERREASRRAEAGGG